RPRPRGGRAAARAEPPRTLPGTGVPRAHGGQRRVRGDTMRDAVAAEWVKLRSVRSTWLCLAAGVVVSVLGAVALGGAAASAGERVPATAAVVSVVQVSRSAPIPLAVP